MKAKHHRDPLFSGESLRARYTKPRLREFGPVGSLTQAGTGNSSESAMDMKPMTNKRL